MKKIAVLGSTGSIGRSALSVVAQHRDRFRVVGLTAHNNLSLLKEQALEFRPEAVAASAGADAGGLARALGVPVLTGEAGLSEVASMEDADLVISAIVGSAGLVPTMAAVRAGKTVALANKEALVMAGRAFMEEARKSGARVLPVDSEHSAVFQCLEGRDMASVRKVILTCSGGPFRGMDRAGLERVTPKDALNHPSWSMGRKITVDSATLMNKGLEVIEAHHLFGMGAEDIEVVVHPESIVHSMVEFKDGGVVAQLSVPDMRGAIAYALSWPERLEGVLPPLDLASVGKLTFERPDTESFPCLGLAYEALRAGGTMPAVLNAANEAAVEGFLNGELGFNEIPDIIKKTMDAHDNTGATNIVGVLKAHQWAASHALGLLRAGAPSGGRA
jgi:1-deoxy-D-xylulose-5-phosphate reductoisomerase